MDAKNKLKFKNYKLKYKKRKYDHTKNMRKNQLKSNYVGFEVMSESTSNESTAHEDDCIQESRKRVKSSVLPESDENYESSDHHLNNEEFIINLSQHSMESGEISVLSYDDCIISSDAVLRESLCEEYRLDESEVGPIDKEKQGQQENQDFNDGDNIEDFVEYDCCTDCDCSTGFDASIECNSDKIHDAEHTYEDQFVNLCDENNEEYVEDLNEYDDLQDLNKLHDEIRMSNEFQITGNRIVDLRSVFEDIKRLNRHSKVCDFNDMVLKKETKFGYRSNLYYECTKCAHIDAIRTVNNNLQNTTEPNINYAAVLGILSIGGTFAHLEEFSSVMNIPPMAKTTFYIRQQEVEKDIVLALDKNFKEVMEDEISNSKVKGLVDDNGCPLAKCYADAAWCKRSYRTSYSALSGAASIIGHYSRKVLWIGVANKECRICEKYRKKEIDIPEHKCNCNYTGASTGMEPKLLVDGFRECLSKYNVRFSHLIGDGDSSVICDLNNAGLYLNPMLQIEKIECINHLLRNLRTALRTLAGMNKRNSCFLTDKIMERMSKGIACARTYWNKSDEPWSVKVASLRKDINNIPFHVFGNHKNCSSYFCKGAKENESDIVPELQLSGLFKKIMDRASQSFAALPLYQHNSRELC